MKFWQRLRSYDFIAVVLLTLSAFAFMWAALWPEEGRMLYGFDVERLFYPFGDFMFAALRDGQLPLWNPYIFLGFPQFAEPQLALFYPFTWPMAWLPAAIAFPLQYALHFAWAAVGGYVLIRRLGGQWSGALLGGFALAYALTMTVRIFVGHMPHLMTLAWIPWCLIAAHWAVEKRSWAATIVAGLPLGLAFLIGYIPYWILLVPAVSIFMAWLAFLSWQEGDRKGTAVILGQLVIIGLVGAALAAVQLLPTIEFTSLSSRVTGRYNFADSYPIDFAYLLTVLMPDIYGAPRGTVELWLQNLPGAIYWEWAVYIGVLPLILAGLAWVNGRKQWRFWLILGVLGVLAALGDKGAFHRLLFDFVPGMNWFRFASRPAYFFSLGIAVLAGLMFDHWFNLPAERHKAIATQLKTLLKWFVPVGLILIIAAVLWQAAQAGETEIAIVGAITGQMVRFLLLAVASLSLLIWGYGRPRWQITFLALAILAVDLWGVGNKFISDVRQEPELGWVMADIVLPENREEYRVSTKALSENSGYFYGFYSEHGYDGFMLERSEVMYELSIADARVARLLSTAYMLHGPWWEMPITAPGWELLTAPAGVTIYARDDYGPRTFIVHDVLGAADEEDSLRLMAMPELDFTKTAVVETMPDTQCDIGEADPALSEATISVYEPERVVIQANAAAGGWLVLNDLYYPGWQVTVDGQPMPLQVTNYALRGVCVPAGASEVIFTFQPTILRYGAIISALATLLLLVAAFMVVRQRA